MFVYMIGAFSPKRLVSIKVGVTKDVAKRIKQIQTGQALEVRLIAAWKAKGRLHAFDVEASVHRQFGKQRVRGEWYRDYMIRRLRGYLESALGEAAVNGQNSGAARRRERTVPEHAIHDLRVTSWLRSNGLLEAAH